MLIEQTFELQLRGLGPEASLRLVAPGRDFVVAHFTGQNKGEDQKKKIFAAKRVGVLSKSMWWPKQRSLPTNQWIFALKKKTNPNGITPKW